MKELYRPRSAADMVFLFYVSSLLQNSGSAGKGQGRDVVFLAE